MVFKGLIMQMVNSGFTLSNGPDLYVQGNDTSVQITLEGNDFENNTSAHWPHIFVDAGIEGFDFRNNECLNNDSFKSQGCLWFDSTLAVQGQVSIGVGNEVRASSGNNPYVAFKLTGANTVVDTFTTEPVYWQVFDGTGQVRFSGWNFKPITGQVKFSISALDTALLSVSGYGDVIPLHLGPSTGEGEWVPYHIPASGITYSTGTLTASTGYYFYVYNSAAANLPFVGTLTAATTGPVASSPGGYYVETGDTRKTYIGFAQTDSGGHFQITGVQTSQYPAGLGAISQIIPISMGTIALPQNSTIYTLMTANGAPASIQALCPKGGWFSGLSVLSTAPAAGQTLTATWQVSNIDTPLTCTITGTATTCKDSTHFAICPADSPYHLKLVTSATTGTLANIGGGVLFQHN
jgi:hypothetical protein